MGKVLVMTAGTNPTAIASILTRVKETFGYDEALILATSASKKDAEEALRLLREDGIYVNRPEIDTELMDALMARSIAGNASEVVIALRDKFRELCQRYDEIYVDVTSGTKLMSTIVGNAAISMKAGSSEGGSKSIGPCTHKSIYLGYVTHMEIAQAQTWWVKRDCEGCGYYPKVPRIAEIPWVVNLEDWVDVQLQGKPFESCPKEIPHPLFKVQEDVEPLLRSLGSWTWLLNCISREGGEVELRGTSFTWKTKNWGSSAVETAIDVTKAFDKEKATSFSTLIGRSSLYVEGVGGNPKEIEKLGGSSSLRGLSLGELLLYLRSRGYKGPIYLDTNVLSKGFHNEYFHEEVIGYLLGEWFRKRRLNVKVPSCIYYELVRGIEENKKYRTDLRKSAVNFLATTVGAMVAKLLGIEESRNCWCDPELHELAGRGGLLVTADKGLFDNVRNDESVKGVAVFMVVKEDQPTFDFVKNLVEGYSSEYLHNVLRTAEALRRHAVAVQSLSFLSAIADSLNVKTFHLKGEREASLTWNARGVRVLVS